MVRAWEARGGDVSPDAIGRQLDEAFGERFELGEVGFVRLHRLNPGGEGVRVRGEPLELRHALDGLGQRGRKRLDERAADTRLELNRGPLPFVRERAVTATASSRDLPHHLRLVRRGARQIDGSDISPRRLRRFRNANDGRDHLIPNHRIGQPGTEGA